MNTEEYFEALEIEQAGDTALALTLLKQLADKAKNDRFNMWLPFSLAAFQSTIHRFGNGHVLYHCMA